jgi:hypothetical protein
VTSSTHDRKLRGFSLALSVALDEVPSAVLTMIDDDDGDGKELTVARAKGDQLRQILITKEHLHSWLYAQWKEVVATATIYFHFENIPSLQAPFTEVVHITFHTSTQLFCCACK